MMISKATKGKMMRKATNRKQDAMMMSEATNRKTAPGNDDLASARSLVKRHLEEALEDREADIKVLRQLISQIDEASPYLVQKFASQARYPRSRIADEFMASAFGYFGAEGEVVPFCGHDDVIRLDAFLSHHLTEEALRRTRDASRREYETY
jgi:hypothetical protein